MDCSESNEVLRLLKVARAESAREHAMMLLAYARRAELLPCVAVLPQAVIESEARQDGFEVVDMHARGEGLAAPDAHNCVATLACLLLQPDAQLSRPLEDVEELAERQVE